MANTPAKTKTPDGFYLFMEEYTDFLERMRGDEQARLFALESRDLAKIETTISTSQANSKQLENYELKRASVQAGAGFAGFTFKEVLCVLPPECKTKVSNVFDRFERNVSDIRFFNNKCMAVARDGMMDINPSAVLPTKTGGHINPYQAIQQKEVAQNSSILETKV